MRIGVLVVVKTMHQEPRNCSHCGRILKRNLSLGVLGSYSLKRCLCECDDRATRMTVLLICVTGSLCYLYLYSKTNYYTLQIEDSLKKTLDSLKSLTKKEDSAMFGIHMFSSIKRKKEFEKAKSKNEKGNPIITLFTSWVTKPEKYICHNNTFFNWNYLKPYVSPILFTNDSDLENEALSKGWQVLPVRVTATKQNVPVLRYMYMDVMRVSNSSFLAYVNGDILFTHSLIETLISLQRALDSSYFNASIPLLMIGQRINVMNVSSEEVKSHEKIHAIAKNRGKLFTAWGEDYFITTRNYPWEKLADVIIGRLAYDNWMVWNAKRSHFTTIDATKTLLAVHQTTKSGNMEGHHKPDGNYNNNVIRKMYKQVKYGAGLTTCAEYFTSHKTNESIEFSKRVLNRGCIA